MGLDRPNGERESELRREVHRTVLKSLELELKRPGPLLAEVWESCVTEGESAVVKATLESIVARLKTGW